LPAAIAYLLQGAALGLTAAASPGPFQTYLINQALTGGWRRAAPISLAPLLSDLPIILVVLLLLDQLPENFLSLINLAGGFFVFFLAWGFWKNWRVSDNSMPLTSRNNPSGVLRRGIVMNLLSPGPYTFWALVNGPILLNAFRTSTISGIAFLSGFYTILTGGFLAVVLLFDQARRFGQKAVRTLTLLSILVLVAFGGLLIYQGISGLID
jgi:threonine/homoserine/homoserine lactone efflux protein